LAQVEHELVELEHCDRVMPEKRKRLLQVLHATRALDTTLGEVLVQNGISSPPMSLGPRLRQLAHIPSGTRGHLSQSAIQGYVAAISTGRNKYAHRANAFPSSTLEVDRIVSEVGACLADIL
jgi:hypothetical protein